MKNTKLVKELQKELKSDHSVSLTLSMGKYSVTEVCDHSGYWGDNEYSVSCRSRNNWKRAEVEAKFYDLDSLIDLLKEKNLSEMGPEDFEDKSLGNASDGSVDVDEIEWDGDDKPTDEELEDLDDMDLYNLDINDNEIEFEVGSIWQLEAIINGKHKLILTADDTYTIEYGPRIKKWTKADKTKYEQRYVAAMNELIELQKQYELLMDERIDENLPELEYSAECPTFGNGKVKLVLDDRTDWRKKDVVEFEFTNEVGARFVFHFDNLKKLVKLRNEVLKQVDKFDRPYMDASEVEDAWENKPEEEPEYSYESDDENTDEDDN